MGFFSRGILTEFGLFVVFIPRHGRVVFFYISWHFVLCFFVGFPKFGHVGPPLVLSDLLLRKIDHKVVSKRQNAVTGAILSAQVI